jgi:hypothetical protein
MMNIGSINISLELPMIHSDKWESMTVDERHEYILSKLKSGELEIVYARPEKGLFYLTVLPPKDVVKPYYGDDPECIPGN